MNIKQTIMSIYKPIDLTHISEMVKDDGTTVGVFESPDSIFTSVSNENGLVSIDCCDKNIYNLFSKEIINS